ncbi:exodeoxyribonuclease V subunit beta [Flavobacterium sp.]|uniref:UvrD-helicase domain-containing protein n=1 Tax=Flavobacterium sp. TaxID=239 RepID=UPI0026154BDB|nr:UvrD-helicase domain-containing protein [Flavobacterium sp.]
MIERPSFSLYDASAGSGKTFTLVKEYLKIILTAKKNDAYRHILAITFTNKAVHEMKSRIVDNLSEFTKVEPHAKAQQLMELLSYETGLSLSQIKIKSQEIIKHIIHNYAAFDILTIDKFTHKVIRAFAHDLNLPITFEVTLDTEALLTEAVDAIIAQAGEDKTLTKLLIDFTMEKTDDDKSWDISREILETSKLIFNENNREEISQLNQKDIRAFIEIKQKLKAKIEDIEKQNIEYATSAMALIEKHNIDLKSFSAGHFPNHLLNIINGNFNPQHKKYHEPEDVRINKTAADRPIIESIIDELLSILKTTYKNFDQRDFYRAFLKNITPLSLLQTVSNELAKIQTEQNVLSIAEFNALIHREIHEQPAPFIYERLGERYRHFFIDEFQDTSEMQWQNLVPLIDNALSSQNEAGEKGTLMIVGDPKQSIYRWRGGKAEQFIALSKERNPKDKKENPFSNPYKKVTHLDTNYRSYSEIIDFNNSFFKYLSNEFTDEDYKDLYENHSHQEINQNIGGYVNLTFLPLTENFENDAEQNEELDKKEQYCQATFQTIQKVIKEGFVYTDIAILTRKRDQGIAVANFLTEQNIPLVSSETLLIENASEVQFIIHVLRYLKNDADIESKANFLFYIAKNCQNELPEHDFIAQGVDITKEVEFEAFLKKIDISIKFNNIRKKSLYEGVEAIISTFIFSKQNHAYLQYFLDIILERDYHKQAGISDFLNYWDKNSGKHSIPSPEGNNAVKIMTIHKSKGLEFPVVIMPFADEDYEKKPKDKLWLEADEADFGLQKVLIDNTKAITGFGEKASLKYNRQKQEELLDNINILYVALTRAQEQLYLISQMVKPKKDGEYPHSMAALFTKYLLCKGVFNDTQRVYEFGTPRKLSKETVSLDTSKSITYVSERFNPDSIRIAQKEALLWGTQQQEAIEYGNIIHEILSLIHTEDDIDTAMHQSVEMGLIQLKQKDEVYRAIHQIIRHPSLEKYFASGNRVFNEQSIIQKHGQTFKPDRMVLTPDNELLLLDYKTGKHLEKHRQQLENYQQVIEEMNFKVTKKALVYIGKSIEVIPL